MAIRITAPPAGARPVYPIPKRQLRAGSTAYDAVIVDYYISASDGGGGTFFYNSGDTSSADNYGTIIVDAAGHRYYRITEGQTYSVLWFGADHTGAADSLAAFQHALAAASEIFIPTGHYMLSANLSYSIPAGLNAVTIRGAGQDNAVLYWPSGGGLTINYGTFVSNNNTSAHISDLTLTSGAAGAGYAIYLDCSTSGSSSPAYIAPSSISNVTIRGNDGYGATDYWSIGVCIANVSQVYLDQVYINGSGSKGGFGVQVTGNASSDKYAVVCNLVNCNFNLLNIGVYYGSYVQGLQMSNCNFTGGNYGIFSQTSETGDLDELNVVNCQFNVADSAILANTSINDTTILGSLFLVPASGYGVYLRSIFFNIIGNDFQGPGGSGVGIEIFNGGPGVISGNVITSFTNGISISSGASGVNVQSNAYSGNSANVANSGTGNTIGGGSP